MNSFGRPTMEDHQPARLGDVCVAVVGGRYVTGFVVSVVDGIVRTISGKDRTFNVIDCKKWVEPQSSFGIRVKDAMGEFGSLEEVKAVLGAYRSKR